MDMDSGTHNSVDTISRRWLDHHLAAMRFKESREMLRHTADSSDAIAEPAL